MTAIEQNFNHYFDLFSSYLNQAIIEQNTFPLTYVPQNLYHLDGRTPLFQLQGLARICRKTEEDQTLFENLLVEFKSIEDAIGQYDYWVILQEKNKTWKFPKEIEVYFHDQAMFHLGVVTDRLLEFGWLEMENKFFKFSPKAKDRFEALTKRTEWTKDKKFKQELAKFMIKTCERIEEKMDNHELDLTNLEDGIHEFRRNIRWIGIYVSALRGKIQLGKEAKDLPLSHYCTEGRDKDKFNQIPNDAGHEDVLYFLPGGFYALNDLIKTIGELKDRGIFSEEMMHLGKAINFSEKDIISHLKSDYITEKELVKKAKETIEFYLYEEHLFDHIKDYFKTQMD